jgi:hypothetical protein
MGQLLRDFVLSSVMSRIHFALLFVVVFTYLATAIIGVLCQLDRIHFLLDQSCCRRGAASPGNDQNVIMLQKLEGLAAQPYPVNQYLLGGTPALLRKSWWWVYTTTKLAPA